MPLENLAGFAPAFAIANGKAIVVGDLIREMKRLDGLLQSMAGLGLAGPD
jgi:hypothetical protein